MKALSKIMFVSAMFTAGAASAQMDASVKAAEEFLKSPGVIARMESIRRHGFIYTPEKPVVVLKHYFTASYGVSERGYLVSQVFRQTPQAWGRATNITAVVNFNSMGNVTTIDVIDFKESGFNDVNGGLGEN